MPNFENLTPWDAEEIERQNQEVAESQFPPNESLKDYIRRIGKEIFAGDPTPEDLAHLRSIADPYWVDMMSPPSPEAAAQLKVFAEFYKLGGEFADLNFSFPVKDWKVAAELEQEGFIQADFDGSLLNELKLTVCGKAWIRMSVEENLYIPD